MSAQKYHTLTATVEREVSAAGGNQSTGAVEHVIAFTATDQKIDLRESSSLMERYFFLIYMVRDVLYLQERCGLSACQVNTILSKKYRITIRLLCVLSL